MPDMIVEDMRELNNKIVELKCLLRESLPYIDYQDLITRIEEALK